MSLLSRALLTALALVTLAIPALAQQTGGTIRGKVQNASNGAYLENVSVVIAGTSKEALTNSRGEFELRNVPAGEVTLQASYIGEPTQSATVTVTDGAAATLDFAFRATATTLRDKDGVLQLDPYTVNVERYQNAQAIAIAAERNSVNLKSVVAADQFGNIPSGNVGEFVKYLPGVEIDYGGTYTSPSDASGISVRGFGAADTIIYIDGQPVSSASPGSLSNAVGLDMLSISNASRVELIKVPTPDMSMDAIGGQINLVTKSAFEQAKPSFHWNAYVTLNTEYLSDAFKSVPGPTNKKVFSTLPGFDLTYVKPISDKLGFSVTVASYNEFTANRRLQSDYRYEQETNQTTNLDLRAFGGTTGSFARNAKGTVSLTNPFLQRVQVSDAPRFSHRNSLSFKADWRPFDGLTTSARYTYSQYESADATRRILARVRRPQDWGADFTTSFPFLTAAQATAMGRAAGTITSSQSLASFTPNNSLDMDVDSRDKVGNTHSLALNADYRKGPWTISASAGYSFSRGTFKDFENGHFSKVEMSSTIGLMKFRNVTDGVPGTIEVYDRNDAVFDWTDLSKWSVNNFKAYSGRAESSDEIQNYKVDVRRELDFIPFDWVQLSFKTGYERKEETQKKWGVGTGYRESYSGPTLALTDYMDQVYTGIAPGYNFPAQQWPSTYALYDFYKANASAFSITDADAAENWFSLVGQNKRITTVRENWYAMLDGKSLKNRLSFVAGLRDGQDSRHGSGPRVDGKWNYVKNADGTLYRNSALLGTVTGTVRIDQTGSKLFATDAIGTALRSDLTSKGISFPTAALTTATLARAQLQRQALQPVRGKSTGEPNYMAGFKYDITTKLVGTLNWSRKFGRVDLENGANGILSGNGEFSVNEAEDPSAAGNGGEIKVANPNLQPQISNDWDLDLAYYTDAGGKISLGYYTKNTTNFQETIGAPSGTPLFDSVLTAIGLDAIDYDDWIVTTRYNVPGVTRTYGYELDVRQDLRGLGFLGDWGKRIQVFGNYSTKQRKNPAAAIADVAFAEGTAAAGLNMATNRFSLLLRANWLDYKRTKRTSLTFDADGDGTAEDYLLGEYLPPKVKLDLDFSWQFAKKYSFYITARDILNDGQKTERFIMQDPDLYPDYAHTMDQREFGVNVTFGIRGSF